MTTWHRHMVRSTAACAVVLLMSFPALAGCSRNEPVVNSSSAVSAAPVKDEVPAAPVQATTDAPRTNPVDELSGEVKAALEAAVANGGVTTEAQVRAAFEEAGANPEVIESSQDITPTGLEVESLEAAAPVDGTCIFAQVRETAITVTRLPVLHDGSCFVGDQR